MSGRSIGKIRFLKWFIPRLSTCNLERLRSASGITSSLFEASDSSVKFGNCRSWVSSFVKWSSLKSKSNERVYKDISCFAITRITKRYYLLIAVFLEEFVLNVATVTLLYTRELFPCHFLHRLNQQRLAKIVYYPSVRALVVSVDPSME